MANVLKLKRGSSVPDTNDIAAYEIAYRTGTQELYINDGGTVRQIGSAGSGGGDIEGVTAGTGLSGGGTTGTVTLNVDASQTQITAVGTIGTGVWQGTDVGVAYGGTGASTLASDSVLTGTGTSAITAEANLTFDGTDLKLIGDDKEMRWGAGGDFKIYVNSDDAYLVNATEDKDMRFMVNDGNSTSGANVTALKIDGSDAGTAIFSNNISIPAASKLYLDGNAGGTYITESAGDLIDLYVGGVLLMRFEETGTDSVFTSDNVHLGVGTHKDLRIYHNSSSSNNNIENHSGSLYVTNYVDDADIIFRTDDGSGGVADYITLDGSASKVTFFGSRIDVNSDGTAQWGSAAAHGRLTWDTNQAVVTTVGTNDLTLTAAAGQSVIVNNYQQNVDFRVEGDSIDDMIFADASSGRVGIGEDSLDANLHISGSPVVLKFDRVGTRALRMGIPDDSNKFIFADSDDLKSSQHMTIDGSGNIGIGTVSPSYKLDVNRADAGIIAQFQYGTDTDGRIQIYADANAGSIGNDSGLAGETIYFQDDLGLRFYTSGSEAMRLDTSNQLGIGMAPDRPLNVNRSGDGNVARFSHSGSTGSVDIYSAAAGGLINVRNGSGTSILELDGRNDTSKLGTVQTGVWNGTAIASAYLDADTAHLSGTQTFSGAKTFSSHLIFPDNILALFGSGNKLQMGHKETYAFLGNYEGHFYIDNYDDDYDIVFRADDGSGGLANYIVLDSSDTSVDIYQDIKLTNTKKLYLDNGLDTYINEVAANAIGFATGGGERMRIDTTGLGIGTTSPATKLHIETSQMNPGSTSALPIVRIAGSYGGGLGFLDTKESGMYQVDNGDTWNFYCGRTIGSDTALSKVALTMKSDGDIGIGTVSPTQKLDVAGHAHIEGNIFFGDDSVWQLDDTSWTGGSANQANFMLTGASGWFGFHGDSSNTVSILADGAIRAIDYVQADSGNVQSAAGVDLELRRGTNDDDRVSVQASETRVYGDSSMRCSIGSYGYRSDMDGSAGTPCYSWRSDTNTGILRTASDTIGFATGGSTRFTMDGAGVLYVSSKVQAGNGGIEIWDATHGFKNVIAKDSTYTKLLNNDGAVNIYLGDSGDGNNYYNSGGHRFRSMDGGTYFGALNSTGLRLGTGTSFASYRLDVAGDVRITHSGDQMLRLARSGANEFSLEIDSSRMYWYNRTTSTALWALTNAGNVGIGTVSPAYKLDVTGNARFTTDIKSEGRIMAQNGTAAAPAYSFTSQGDAGMTRVGNGVGFSADDYSRVEIDAEKMFFRYNSTSNSTTGACRIQFPNDQRIFDNGAGGLKLGAASHAVEIYSGSSTDRIVFINGGISGSETARIIPGKMGIMTTTPYEALEVESQSSTSPAIVAANQASNGCFNMAHGYSGANGDYVNTYSTQYSSIATVIGYGVKASTDTNDQFLCSADNSNFTRGALVIDDELRFWTGAAANGTLNSAMTMTERMRVDPSGNAHFDADVVAYSTTVSDKRLKDNIETIPNALDKVMQLRGVEFDWNATSRKGQHDIGVIAQEVEKVLPEVVKKHTLCTGEFGGEGNEKEFKTVDYDKMIGVLIEAVKQQQEEIELLKANYSDLKYNRR